MEDLWPVAAERLETLQRELGQAAPEPWQPTGRLRVGGCFVCFPRGIVAPGRAGDPGWASAVVMEGKRSLATSVTSGTADAPYEPGLLAAREGRLLEAAVRGLDVMPEVLLVNATGRDHPRRGGLALHLGWVVGLPTVGVTHRPLLARGDPPQVEGGSVSPLWIGSEQVGWWLRTRPGVRPLAVSPGWRTDLNSALEVVKAAVSRVRTPEPLRRARRLAREARTRQSG